MSVDTSIENGIALKILEGESPKEIEEKKSCLKIVTTNRKLIIAISVTVLTMVITVGVMIALLYDPSKGKASFQFEGRDIQIASAGADTHCTGGIQLNPNFEVEDSEEM